MYRVVRRCCFVVVILSFSPTVIADRADDAKMASEALAPYISSKASLGDRQARVESVHANVRVHGGEKPNEEISVTIVFDRGLSIPKLGEIAAKYKLEIVDIHLKTPYNDRGVVQSIDIGAVELARYRGGFVARAEKAVGAVRYQFLQWAENLSSDAAESHRRMVRQDMHIYRCEAYGRAQDVSELLVEKVVAVVIPEPAERSAARIAHHKDMRGRAERAWEARYGSKKE